MKTKILSLTAAFALIGGLSLYAAKTTSDGCAGGSCGVSALMTGHSTDGADKAGATWDKAEAKLVKAKGEGSCSASAVMASAPVKAKGEGSCSASAVMASAPVKAKGEGSCCASAAATLASVENE